MSVFLPYLIELRKGSLTYSRPANGRLRSRQNCWHLSRVIAPDTLPPLRARGAVSLKMVLVNCSYIMLKTKPTLHNPGTPTEQMGSELI